MSRPVGVYVPRKSATWAFLSNSEGARTALRAFADHTLRASARAGLSSDCKASQILKPTSLAVDFKMSGGTRDRVNANAWAFFVFCSESQFALAFAWRILWSG